MTSPPIPVWYWYGSAIVWSLLLLAWADTRDFRQALEVSSGLAGQLASYVGMAVFVFWVFSALFAAGGLALVTAVMAVVWIWKRLTRV